jgi:large subunit ribosomal protein L25
MADQITLRAETGRATGSRESRRIRRTGGVPAIVYGRGIDPLPVVVDHHDLMSAIQHGGSNAVITLDTGSETHVTMPRVIERHPFRNLIRHVDFLKISLTEKTQADIAIHLIGDAVGVKDGGILNQALHTVTVEALPMALPGAIEVDVTELGFGEHVTVADLPAIPGVEYVVDDPEMLVAAVTAPAAEVEPEVTEEEGAEEGVAGEEGGDQAGGESEEAEAGE